MNARRALLLVCALAVFVGVAATWPVGVHLDRLAPTSAFTGGHIAALSVATATPPWITHTPLAGWPGGVDFRPLLWPSILLAHLVGALAAYDLTVLLTPLVNVLGGWALGRAVYAEERHAVALGALLAFPPWVRTTLQNGQPEQALLGVGAALIGAVVWASRGSAWRLALVAPVVALAGVSTPHVVLAALVLVGVWALAGARAEPRRLVVLALCGAGAAAVAAYHSPGFDRSVPHFFAPFGLLEASAGPVPKRAVLVHDLVWRAGLPPGKGPGVLHLGYLGVPLLLGAGLAAWRDVPRGARWPLAAAALSLALAFGESGPFWWLGSVSATLSASGTPYRFTIGALLALCLLCAPARWAPALAALSLLESLWVDPRPLPFPSTAWPTDPPGVDLGTGPGPVLDIPLVSRGCREAAAHYLAETGRHGRPSPLLLRSGELAWPDEEPTHDAIYAALGSPDCARELAPLLRDWGAVVVHRDTGCKLRPSELRCLEAVLGPPQTAGELRYWVLDR